MAKEDFKVGINVNVESGSILIIYRLNIAVKNVCISLCLKVAKKANITFKHNEQEKGFALYVVKSIEQFLILRKGDRYIAVTIAI